MLTAAEGLFASKGYHETSMEDIAKAAEYATGTIYRYFASKEELYRQLLNRKIALYFVFVKERVESCTGPVEQLRSLVRSKVEFFELNREFMRIYAKEAASNQTNAGFGALNTQCRSMQDEYRDLVRGIFERGIAEGAFHKQEVDRLMAAFAGVSNVVLLDALEKDEASLKPVEEFLCEFLEGAVRTRVER